jgi:hypothetical protein
MRATVRPTGQTPTNPQEMRRSMLKLTKSEGERCTPCPFLAEWAMAEIRQFGPVALCPAAMGSHGGANGTVRHCGLSVPGSKLGQHQVSA